MLRAWEIEAHVTVPRDPPLLLGATEIPNLPCFTISNLLVYQITQVSSENSFEGIGIKITAVIKVTMFCQNATKQILKEEIHLYERKHF